MAKKDTDNFDFEVEGEGKEKGKVSLNLDFIKNLTKQQKGIILAALVGIVLVIAIIIVVIIVGANNGNNGGTTNPGGDNGNTDGGENDELISGEVTDFYLSSPPVKIIYYVGDVPDYTGLSIFVRSSDGGSHYIDYVDHPEDFTITGFDSSEPAEEQTITVEYEGKSVTFTVKILPNSIAGASLVRITVDPLPKTTYKVGKSFNPTGGVIICEYSDGTIKNVELTREHVIGYGSIAYTPGEHQLKIKYIDDNGGYAETYITVTITE